MKRVFILGAKIELGFFALLFLFFLLLKIANLFSEFFPAGQIIERLVLIMFLIVIWVISLPLAGLEMITSINLLEPGIFPFPSTLGWIYLVLIIYFINIIFLGLFSLIDQWRKKV